MSQQFVPPKITKKQFSVLKQPCGESSTVVQVTNLSVKIHKVQNMIPDQLQQAFPDTFYSKVLSYPNCISKVAATKPCLNLFKIFENIGLETFLGFIP